MSDQLVFFPRLYLNNHQIHSKTLGQPNNVGRMSLRSAM